MNRRLLVLPAAVAVLAGCGGSDTPAPDRASSTDSAPPASTQPGEPGAGGGNADLAPDLEFQDQVGAGDTALVARVGMPTAGFVVVSGEDGAVLGSAEVGEGAASDLEVPLDPPLTEDAELTAALYADTDGDGAFDPAADEQLRESPDDEAEDEPIEVDASYDVR